MKLTGVEAPEHVNVAKHTVIHLVHQRLEVEALEAETALHAPRVRGMFVHCPDQVDGTS